MKFRITILAMLTVFTALIAVPAHLHGLQQALAEQQEQHHPDTVEAPDRTTVPETPANMMANMTASDAKINELVKKMNAATGSEKTDAIAELLTALVQDHRTMRGSMMANMMSMMNMMNMMGGTAGHSDASPATPKK